MRGIGDGEDIGLIAQDVEKVMPELVVQDTDGFRAVHYERLPMLLLQSVRELKSENDTLKRLLTEQEARLGVRSKRRACISLSRVTSHGWAGSRGIRSARI